ncbi:hypothetical protein CPB86DRAFT_94573 [Serendipita vermifera]|nr:hypothetical protein CPB86DRAFT_94573 [Serendipita vermifera]
MLSVGSALGGATLSYFGNDIFQSAHTSCARQALHYGVYCVVGPFTFVFGVEVSLARHLFQSERMSRVFFAFQLGATQDCKGRSISRAAEPGLTAVEYDKTKNF